MKKIIIYAGQRLDTSDKAVQAYYDTKDEDIVLFKKKLLGYEAIGFQLEAENEGNSWSEWKAADKNNKADIDESLITEWSAKHRAAISEKNAISEAKKEHPKSIVSIVDQLSGALKTMKYRDRARVALWVYNELIK